MWFGSTYAKTGMIQRGLPGPCAKMTPKKKGERLYKNEDKSEIFKNHPKQNKLTGIKLRRVPTYS